jgi:RES domain-containing protein
MPRRSTPSVRSWEGIVYRGTSWDTPLWAGPNRRDGRWNIGGTSTVQYFCADPEAPFAEMLRHEELRTEAEAQTYWTNLWQTRVHEASLVDYSTFELAETAGFPADALVEDDHERCQAEAEWLKGRGVRGLLSPSAALPGSVNLTLFGPRVEIPWDSQPRLASQLPVQLLSRSHPPVGLVSLVRYFGEIHPSLVAFQTRRT